MKYTTSPYSPYCFQGGHQRLKLHLTVGRRTQRGTRPTGIIQRVAILYLAGNVSLSCVENKHREWAGRGGLLQLPGKEPCGSGRNALGGWARLPGVLSAAAAFHLFTLGCQDDTEVTQIIEQLQCPILGHWKGTFFLQMNFPSPPIKGDGLSGENKQLRVLSAFQLVISEAFYTQEASFIS